MVDTNSRTNCENILSKAADLTYCHWTIKITFQQKVSLEAYKGNILHGGFGRALAAIDTALYNLFYSQPKEDNRWVSPFIISSEDLAEHYPEKSTLTINLTLLGEVVFHAHKIVQAFIHWQQLGFGPTRTKFSVDSIVNNHQQLVFHQTLPVTIPSHDDLTSLIKPLWLKATWPHHNISYLLTTLTRCRIQWHGQPLTQVPALPIWINAIQRRFNQLLRAPAPLRVNARLTDDKLPKYVDAKFNDWQKFSVAGKKVVKIGGLSGQWCYSNITPEEYLWLLIGQHIGIGNKCSFGFGRYTGQLAQHTTNG